MTLYLMMRFFLQVI